VKSPLTTRAALLALLSDGEAYGLELIERGVAKTGGALRLHVGTIYSVLDAIEDEGLAESRTGESPEGGKPRRYYRLTDAGRREADVQREVSLALWGRAARTDEGSD
jgi:PadR family transcriptional regulator, regulatory protein PadR